MSVNRLSLTTILLKCGVASVVLFSPYEALASNPASSARFLNLEIDYQQCLTKARQAAGIVLSRVEPSHTVNEGVLGFFGKTSGSAASIMCIQDRQNSIFMVVTNSDAYNDRLTDEAKSISDRFIQIMSGDI